MNTVVSPVLIASTERDAAAVEAVKGHHEVMAATLGTLAERIGSASSGEAALAARDALVDWAHRELVPHARAEEQAMYPLAHATTEARLLVDAMLAEHVLIVGLVDRLATAAGQVAAAAEARALEVTFRSHLAKENDQILPLLAGRAEVSLAGALDGMHELLGGGQDEHGHGGHEHGGHEEGHSEPAGAHHGCACGEVDSSELPVLDARQVPHAIRHATIFGALDAVQPGGGLVLLAPHDPLPMLRQLEQRAPGRFVTDYLERGPEVWALRFRR